MDLRKTICLASCAILLTGAACSQSQLAMRESASQGSLLRDGRLRKAGIDVLFQGKSLQIPMFRFQDKHHLAGISGEPFQMLLVNHSAKTVRLALEVSRAEDGPLLSALPSQANTHCTPGAKSRVIHTLRPGQRKVVRSFRFPTWNQGVEHLDRVQSLRLRWLSSSQQSASIAPLDITFHNCRAYESRRICPPTCLCQVRGKRPGDTHYVARYNYSRIVAPLFSRRLVQLRSSKK